MAEIAPNVQKAVVNMARVHPKYSIRDFKEEFSEMYQRQPSEAEKELFLQSLSDHVVALSEVIKILETLGLRQILRYSEVYPDLVPKKIETTATQISAIQDMRKRRTEVYNVLDQMSALEPLLPAGDLVVVRKYMKNILLPASHGGGDDLNASAYLAVMNIEFPTNSLNRLIQRNNQIFDSNLFHEIMETRTPIAFPLAFVPVVDSPNVTNMGTMLAWNSNTHRTFYVNPEISEGIYKMTIACKGSLSGIALMFGLVAENQIATISQIRSQQYLSAATTGTCAFACTGIYTANIQVFFNTLFSAANTAAAPQLNPRQIEARRRKGQPIPEITPAQPVAPTLVSLELDAYKNVLYCFVNGEQIPYSVINVPPSVHFALSAQHQGITVELRSLARLAAASVNVALACTQYKWI